MEIATLVTFLVCHIGPAEHFAYFAKVLSDSSIPIRIISGENEERVFSSKGIPTIPYKDDLEYLALLCQDASCIITDVGFEKHEKLHRRFSAHPRHFAYYDNPESFVPGGYSETAAKIIKTASGILFANADFATHPICFPEGIPIPYEGKNIHGIGFYPWMIKAKTLRSERGSLYEGKKDEYLAKLRLRDRIKKVILYLGGNNAAYYDQAFPAFLEIFEAASYEIDFSDTLLVLAQHPVPKKSPTAKDFLLFSEKKGVLASNPKAPVLHRALDPTDELLLFAYYVCYYQTSISPLLWAAGVPFFQIGHAPYNELLITTGKCPAVTSSKELLPALQKEPTPPLEGDFALFGTRLDFENHLLSAIR
jgi:hypothetical protein